MVEVKSARSSPWSTAAFLAIVLAAVQTILVAVFYRDMDLSDRPLFLAFMGLSSVALWSLTIGAGGALAARWARRHRERGIGAGIGAAAFVLILIWMALAVRTAAFPMFSNVGGAGAVAALFFASILGLVGFVTARSRLGRARLAWGVGPVCALLALAAFLARSGGYEIPEPIRVPMGERTQSPLNHKTTNVLLVTIDTLRADHMDAYGYDRKTAPLIKAFADRGVQFDRAVTQRTTTAPSFATLLTGTYPPVHRVFNNGQSLQDFNLTAAEILATQGYHTQALMSNPNLTAEFNFQQGFEEYQHTMSLYEVLKEELLESRHLNDLVLPAMEKLGDKRFFLWVHYRDPHTPYLVPDDYKDLFTSDALSDANGHRELPVTASGLAGILKGYLGTMPPTAVVHDSHDMDFLIAQYDAEIRFNDDSVGQLFDKMTELRLWDNTLVVFSADHGEGLGEHEYFFAHGRDTYENQAHVPLVFRHPRLPAGVHVPQTVSLVDVFPTILDLLGLSPAPHMQGKSFAPLVLGQKHEGLRPHHYVMGAWRWGYQTHAVTTDTHKLVMTVDERWVALDAVVDLAASLWLPEEIFNVYHYRRTTREFYDLTTDPGEQKNIYGQHPEIEQALSRSLWSWIDATYAEGRNRDAVNPEMDPETVKALKSLGYLN